MGVIGPELRAPIPIADDHVSENFQCGISSLDDWLRKRAIQNEKSGSSRTYVVRDSNRVAGYYCLAAGALVRPLAPKAMQRNAPDPIPVIVLGRLAVDTRWHGRGIGSGMLRDAVVRFLQAADTIGAPAMLVHAISDEAKSFYLSHGFLESPIEPMTLCLPLRLSKQAVG